MAAVLYSASAENDLLEAWLYLADDSVLAADRMLDQIEAEAKRLLDQPMMGSKERGHKERGQAQISNPSCSSPVPASPSTFRGRPRGRGSRR